MSAIEVPVVLQLGSLIADSLSTLSSICSANNLPLPDPSETVLTEESEAFRAYPEAAHAANVIAAAALQLAAALLPPKQSLFHLVSGVSTNRVSCVRMTFLIFLISLSSLSRLRQ